MISVVIPCYEMHGRGVEMLGELLDSIDSQTFRDYEIVISDADPSRDMIAMLAARGLWPAAGREGAAANFNRAIAFSVGRIIKPMFQDDKFIEPDSLQKIADALEHASWVVCTSHNDGEEGFRKYDHVPYIHSTLAALRQGENTYGSPSAVAWRRNELRMDENLAWLFDCEFYARMVERYGCPTFVDTPIYIRQWSGQATHSLSHQRVVDTNYVIEKYR